MQFESLDALLQMGGHGVYVWTAYAVTFVVLGYNLVLPVVLRRRFVSMERRRLARETRDEEIK